MRLGLDAGANTLDLAVELGIQGVPISAEQLVRVGVDATLAPLRGRGLQVCQIGAFGFNVLSTDRAKQARQQAILEQAIPLARATGCPYIVICGGNYHPSGFGAGGCPQFHRRRAGRDRGRAGADVGAGRAARRPAEHRAVPQDRHPLGRALPGVLGPGAVAALCANVDVTSLYDHADMWNPAATIRRTCEGLVGHYGLIHIKELALADGFHIHIGLAPLGQGPTDWTEVLRLVAPHVPDDSWVILEHVATPDEARASVAYLRATAMRAGVSLT